MSDLRKAAEMALEALKEASAIAALDYNYFDAYTNQINNLHQALTQPEQEPVAWMRDLTSPQPHCVTSLKYRSVADTDAGVKYIPVYTAPPSKPWVSLTDEEIINTANEAPFEQMVKADDYIYILARAIEAKLKDKNKNNSAELNEQAEPIVLQNIEQYRMQMAAIAAAALGYWKNGNPIAPPYDTPTLRDVADLYEKYDALHKQNTTKRVCNTCNGTGMVHGLHNWAGGGKRSQPCWNCHAVEQEQPTEQRVIITSAMVIALREVTNESTKACRDALYDCNGDHEKAKKLLESNLLRRRN